MSFKSLRKLAGSAMSGIKSAFDRVANEDEKDAVIAAAVLIAAADGSISDAETEAALRAISSHETLAGFSKDSIMKTFQSDVKLVKADYQEASVVLLEKISKIKDATARIRAIGIAKEIANADGDFSKEEQAVVEKIRRAMR